MDQIRTLIVDDEPLARDGIRVLLDKDPDVAIVGECGNGQEAVESIRESDPDLIFLDVQMPEMTGFEALSELDGDELPFVIFVTAYDQYAIRAFEVHALDYLLKPFDDDRFYAALGRAKAELERRRDSEFADRVAALLEDRVTAGSVNGNRPAAADPGPDAARRREDDGEYLERLVVKRAGRVFFVDVEDIDWIEAADYYVRLHVGEDSHLLRMTMKEMESSLDPESFFRIHRSSIVRLDYIRELEPQRSGEYLVVLADGTRLSLSRSRRKRLEEELGQRL